MAKQEKQMGYHVEVETVREQAEIRLRATAFELVEQAGEVRKIVLKIPGNYRFLWHPTGGTVEPADAHGEAVTFRHEAAAEVGHVRAELMSLAGTALRSS